MKLMKTKLGLSVLALALVGAGAWSLQSPVTTSAATATTTEYLVMENGASVAFSDDFSGIRWTTTVKSDLDANAGSKFGVIVAPTSLIPEGEELTHATALINGSKVKNLPVSGTIDASESDVKYYSVIDYSDLSGSVDADALSQAYKMELTARAYVDLNGDGNYTYSSLESVSTSRSARQVAVSAELAGVVESANMEKAKEYYGASKNVTAEQGFVKNVGAAGTQYIDMENDTTATVSITVDGTIEEVLIGSKSISDYSYEGTTLTLSDLSDIVCGEQYVTVFTDNGIVTKPIIGATKVFDEIEDFEDFKYIRKNLKKNSDGNYKIYFKAMAKDVDGNKIDASKLVHDGYYVLANDIENTNGFKLEDYTWNAKKTVTETTTDPDTGEEVTTETQEDIVCDGYYGQSSFQNAEIRLGLSGTFNGMGYAVKDMEIAVAQQGIFGVINGGTVKNVAFTDVKSALTKFAFGVANYLIDATLENVYVKTDAYEMDGDTVTSIGFPMLHSSGVAQYYYGNTSMTSCVVELSLSSQSGGTSASALMPTGILFSAYQKTGANLTCKDVYCISNNKLKRYTQTLMYIANDTILLGENDEIADDKTKIGNDESILYIHNTTKHKRVWMSGAYRYHTLDLLKNSGKTFESLSASGCWNVVENLPVWKSTQQSN